MELVTLKRKESYPIGKGDSIHWNKEIKSYEREKHKNSERIQPKRCPVDAWWFTCLWNLQTPLIKRLGVGGSPTDTSGSIPHDDKGLRLLELLG